MSVGVHEILNRIGRTITQMDLPIGQKGRGLGLRAFGAPAQLFPMTTQY